MKKTLIKFASACLISTALLTSCSDGNNTNNNPDTDSASNMTTQETTTGTGSTNAVLDTADQSFVMKAASSSLMEVELGNIASQNASSERVKNFAQMMVRDHGQANNQMQGIASQKGITLPSQPMQEHQQHINMLRNKQGRDFDNNYMSHMVQHHEKDVQEFERASGSLRDAELRNFASTNLPVLRMHLDSARTIRGRQ
jgi:putative membrane protein